MKIFDCFTFNNELDILEFRLEKLYTNVDKFVLVESKQTYTGKTKPLYFKEAKNRFKKWEDKISFFECTVNSEMDHWTYEHYQRNFIRECLVELECDDNDIVFISDIDEIVNISHILSALPCSSFRIEMPFYYYFTNLRASEMWDFVVCCQWGDIKNIPIGDRLKYASMFPVLFRDSENKNGGHFSYLFGYSVQKYKQKISSFSHSEFNNFYFKNRVRLKYCISKKSDIYERSWMRFEVTNASTESFNLKDYGMLENSYYPIFYTPLQVIFIKKYIYFLRLIYRILIRTKFLKK